jgi:hypothetical protein
MEWDLFDFKESIMEDLKNSDLDSKEKQELEESWMNKWDSFVENLAKDAI